MKTDSSPTVFGMPAVEVLQPDGEKALYVISDKTPGLWELHRWSITSSDGKSYLVAEMSAGWWRCECPAFTKYQKHGCKRSLPSGQPICKHIFSIYERNHPCPT